MKIQRERWIVTRSNANNTRKGLEVYCGAGHNLRFKPIDDIGDTPIKTYRSKNAAEAGFLQRLQDWEVGDCVECVKILETYESAEE